MIERLNKIKEFDLVGYLYKEKYKIALSVFFGVLSVMIFLIINKPLIFTLTAFLLLVPLGLFASRWLNSWGLFFPWYVWWFCSFKVLLGAAFGALGIIVAFQSYYCFVENKKQEVD